MHWVKHSNAAYPVTPSHLFDERFEFVAEEDWFGGVLVLQQETKVLHHGEGVVIRLQEPVVVVQVVLRVNSSSTNISEVKATPGERA